MYGDEAARRSAADVLLGAYRSGTPVEPLVSQYDGLDLEDAYAIQALQLTTWQGLGRRVLGRKVGLTSAVMQRQLGVDQPDYGVLTDSMFFDEYQPIRTGTFLAPRIEPEIAFVLSRDLVGPGVTVAAAITAVDFVLPSLEIIDSRIDGWRISIIDTIADNASSGGVVLGAYPARLLGRDLRLMGCNLWRNGSLVGTGAGGAVLGSPLHALVWLANVLGARGERLEAGQIILPGSVTAALPVRAGDTWMAAFAGLGTVTAHFAEETT